MYLLDAQTRHFGKINTSPKTLQNGHSSFVNSSFSHACVSWGRDGGQNTNCAHQVEFLSSEMHRVKEMKHCAERHGNFMQFEER